MNSIDLSMIRVSGLGFRVYGGVVTRPPSVGVPRGPVAWQRVTVRPAAIFDCAGA